MNLGEFITIGEMLVSESVLCETWKNENEDEWV